MSCQIGGNPLLVGGKRKHSRGIKRVKRVKRTNRHRTGRKGMRGGNVAFNAGSWESGVGVAPLTVAREGLLVANEGMYGVGQKGGHRCSMRHSRIKRTRKVHAGRKSRKHKSRGKKHGMSLKSIFGRS